MLCGYCFTKTCSVINPCKGREIAAAQAAQSFLARDPEEQAAAFFGIQNEHNPHQGDW